jgi:peptidyl-prolyl cis-trans isomerase C
MPFRTGDAVSIESHAPRTPSARLRPLLREPLLQFFALGAVLFCVLRLFGTQPDAAERSILIDTQVEERLAKLYELQMGAPPGRAQLEALVEDFIRDEVLYREALRMGVGQDDEIIRRRLIQKVEFVTSDMTVVPEPSDASLRTYYTAHPASFTLEPTVTFQHVYFDPDAAGSEAARRRADALRRQLAAHDMVASDAGDPFPLQSSYAQLDRNSAVQLFGLTPIVDELFAQPDGQWVGPFLSGYGWHLFRVTSRSTHTLQTFDAVRERVRQAYLQDEARAEEDSRYQRLRKQYKVVRASDIP